MAAATPVINTEVFNSANRSIRSSHQPFASDTTFLATNDGTTVIAAAKTGHTIYVTKIVVSITTDAAQTLTFRDGAGVPVVIAVVKSSPGIGQLVWDFTEQGTPLTAAVAFNMVASAAGLAARVHVEGYYKLTTVGAPA